MAWTTSTKPPRRKCAFHPFFPAIHLVIRGYRRMFAGKFPFDVYCKIFSGAAIVHSVLDALMNPGTANAQLDSLA